MTIRNQTDFLSGLCVLATGAATLWLSRDLAAGTLTRMGTGYFPNMIGGLLVVIGVVLALLALRAQEPEPVPRLRWRAGLAILASVAGFILGMGVAGLLGAIVATVLLAALADPASRWPATLLLSALTALAAWALFIKGLGLAIPLTQGTF
ncbi:MAG: tripartite tricarboxylate transporter TctB family protein [Paracoccus sp. (in: a-proteobacteria)]|uniref:tripartite tricarboxylate transporter TctB family protein n=1 Tax=Paracoccus sp. TaxID=267 RepID=UPI00391C6CB7